jgi:hypothetical protein
MEVDIHHSHIINHFSSKKHGWLRKMTGPTQDLLEIHLLALVGFQQESVFINEIAVGGDNRDIRVLHKIVDPVATASGQ